MHAREAEAGALLWAEGRPGTAIKAASQKKKQLKKVTGSFASTSDMRYTLNERRKVKCVSYGPVFI